MAENQYILHNFIYESSAVKDLEKSDSFLIHNKIKLGVAFSFLVHAGILGLLLYQKYIAPLELYKIVDQKYKVQWLTLNDPRFKPLKNPASQFVAPQKIRSLEKIKQQQKKEEKHKTKTQENHIESKIKNVNGENSKNSENNSKETSPPKFGQINARPIKEIIEKIYTKYTKGEIQTDNAIFSILITFKVNKDGSLSNINIVKSSKTKEIDEAAINIVNAIGNSHALQPLAKLTSTSISIDNTSKLTTIRLIGFSSTSEEATSLATLFSAALFIAQYKQSEKRPDLAAVIKNINIKAEGNRLTCNSSLTRSQAGTLMRKGFGK